jgi:hypothetical protein
MADHSKDQPPAYTQGGNPQAAYPPGGYPPGGYSQQVSFYFTIIKSQPEEIYINKDQRYIVILLLHFCTLGNRQ